MSYLCNQKVRLTFLKVFFEWKRKFWIMMILFRLPLFVLYKLMSVVCARNCHASAATVQYVKLCPTNESEYEDRAKAKGCFFIGQDCTTPDKFRYHCVLNSYGNASLEVCSPVFFLNGIFFIIRTLHILYRYIDKLHVLKRKTYCQKVE
jgi:hypothetical protein